MKPDELDAKLRQQIDAINNLVKQLEKLTAAVLVLAELYVDQVVSDYPEPPDVTPPTL